MYVVRYAYLGSRYVIYVDLSEWDNYYHDHSCRAGVAGSSLDIYLIWMAFCFGKIPVIHMNTTSNSLESVSREFHWLLLLLVLNCTERLLRLKRRRGSACMAVVRHTRRQLRSPTGTVRTVRRRMFELVATTIRQVREGLARIHNCMAKRECERRNPRRHAGPLFRSPKSSFGSLKLLQGIMMWSWEINLLGGVGENWRLLAHWVIRNAICNPWMTTNDRRRWIWHFQYSSQIDGGARDKGNLQFSHEIIHWRWLVIAGSISAELAMAS